MRNGSSNFTDTRRIASCSVTSSWLNPCSSLTSLAAAACQRGSVLLATPSTCGDSPRASPAAKPAGKALHEHAGEVDRALPRAAGDEEHRVGALVARHRRHHRAVHFDRLALRLRRVERPQHAAAAGGVFESAQFAGLRRRGRRRPGSEGGADQGGSSRRGPGSALV
jgi:hypothetical protein